MNRFAFNIICLVAAFVGTSFGIFGMLNRAPVNQIRPVVDPQSVTEKPPESEVPLHSMEKPQAPKRTSSTPDSAREPTQPIPFVHEAVPVESVKPTGRIFGQVVDHEGVPLKDIRVTSVDYDVFHAVRLDWEDGVENVRTAFQTALAGMDSSIANTTTDEEGRFELTHLDPDSQYRVIVNGEARGEQILKVACGTDLVVVLDDTPHLKVKVCDPAGNPISRVIGYRSGPTSTSRIHTFDYGGVYYFELSKHLERIRIGAAGFVTSHEFLFSEIGTELEVVLEPAPLLTGTVNTRLDKPLDDVLVTVESGVDAAGDEIAIDDEIRKPTARTDTMGRFRLDWLSPGTYTLSFRLDATDSLAVQELEVSLSSDQDVDVQLDTGAHLQLRVIDGEGKPVRGVGVTVTDKDGNKFGRAEGGLPGDFTVIGLPAATLEVKVSSTGRMSHTETINTSTGDARLDVVLYEGARVEGRVLDSAGKAVRGVQLRWKSPVDENGEVQQFERLPIGKEGYYRVGTLRPGEWTVDVVAHGRLEEPVFSETVHVEPGEMTHDIVVESPRTLEATVIFPDVSDGTVVLYLQNDKGEDYLFTDYSGKREVSITVPFLPVGEYTVFARSKSLVSSKRKVWLNTGPAECKLELKPPACFEITWMNKHSSRVKNELELGDLVLAYNGQALTSEAHWDKLTEETKGEAEVSVTVLRDGVELEVKVRGGYVDLALSPAMR